MRKEHALKRFHIPLVILIAASSAAGCYTILRHPGPETDLTDETGIRRDCADCHADADLYHVPGGYDTGWYGYYPPLWADYYAAPWWYDGYWYHSGRSSREAPPAAAGERRVWSRDASNVGSLPTGNANVTPPANSEKPSGGAADKPTRETKEDKKKEEEKKERRIWGR